MAESCHGAFSLLTAGELMQTKLGFTTRKHIKLLLPCMGKPTKRDGRDFEIP